MTPHDFMQRIEKTEDGCWSYRGPKNKQGYGVFYTGTKTIRAHRYVLTLMGKQLTDGLDIDHLCNNRICVNPSHLEEVTPQVNYNRRILGPAMTHCFNGHEFTEENTYISPKRHQRTCRICKSANSRRWHLAKKERDNE